MACSVATNPAPPNQASTCCCGRCDSHGRIFSHHGKARSRAGVHPANPASAQASGTVPGAELATIEGCLVQDANQFQLKNTSGEDAPKERSWKSGFLHRSSKTVDVVDQSRRMNLARHVGERVTITGLLDDRELQGTALKRVAESCS